ncbi:MAG: hypothetical protein M1838_006275 [Thelocarpon superellum]|nr:MAG: hypothetical protein M1838_006275 [Thelocarpon superellum]
MSIRVDDRPPLGSLLHLTGDDAVYEALKPWGVTQEEISPLVNSIQQLQRGDFASVLQSDFAREKIHWSRSDILNDEGSALVSRLSGVDVDSVVETYQLLVVGSAALSAFLQSNVTGPPLPFSSRRIVFGPMLDAEVEVARKEIVVSLTVDGAAIHPLTPDVELFFIAKTIFTHPGFDRLATGERIHVNFLHQRMLTESVSALQEQIYRDLTTVGETILSKPRKDGDAVPRFLLERAAIHTFHGSDDQARADLHQAAQVTGFQFALTGRMGKRTKFQDRDISQLVVLARSASGERTGGPSSPEGKANPPTASLSKSSDRGKVAARQPTALDLNDDTLLESIAFVNKPESIDTTVIEDSDLPATLKDLDPADQPILKPLDAIILLSLASSITNTSPSDGLTREETLPYATRVLEGGSTNWQVYTQALLVRSRIEGYRSRTVERGVLQLQALVDQVIADTTSADVSMADGEGDGPSTFLPRPTQSESAPVTERLAYIHELCSPTRWELEAELARRWLSLGGVKTALEIYERLQMWAEVALCWGALSREDQAKKIVRRELFTSTGGQPLTEAEETWEGRPRDPAPADAARLYCILGDLEQNPERYEQAWEVSKRRYAPAQRSLGKYYFAAKDYGRSAKAYAASLAINQLNHPTWYALGCARLQLAEWEGAIEAFSRAVQLDDQDAESWSNLAAALMEWGKQGDEPSSNATAKRQHRHHKKDALNALKHAAALQHSSWRIWENIITVASSTEPPAYGDIVMGVRRLVEIRAPSQGENAIDVAAVDLLVRHVATSYAPTTASGDPAPGLPRTVSALVDDDVVPAITTSRAMWRIVARLETWRGRPAAALAAYEKAWRAALTTNKGWEEGEEKMWDHVVDATTDLVAA